MSDLCAHACVWIANKFNQLFAVLTLFIMNLCNQTRRKVKRARDEKFLKQTDKLESFVDSLKFNVLKTTDGEGEAFHFHVHLSLVPRSRLASEKTINNIKCRPNIKKVKQNKRKQER